MLHAGVCDQRSWDPLVDHLASGARCLTFDARGFGETSYTAESGWSPVTDAVRVLEDAGAGNAVVVGASLGGRTALDLALARPDLVARLVLIGPAVRGAPQPEIDPGWAELDQRLEAAEEAEDLDEVNRLEAHVWLDGPLQPEGRVGGTVRSLFLDMNGRALAAPDPGEAETLAPAWDRLGEISVPTLVMVGEHDLAHVLQACRHLAATVPGARLVELPGVAHLPHLEADPATLQEIRAFVQQ